jgi:hypothetical protein
VKGGRFPCLVFGGLDFRTGHSLLNNNITTG